MSAPAHGPDATARPAPAHLEVELRSLRQEISIRIVFQNLILCVTWVAFGAALAAAIVAGRAEALGVYCVLALPACAMWAHHGARTAQIRAYLQSTLEPALHGSSQRGWEDALGRMRFESLLGSRWLASTKGFLLGSQLVSGVLLAVLGAGAWAILAAIGALVGSIWVLHEPPLHTSPRD